jgi:LysM repeat protein
MQHVRNGLVIILLVGVGYAVYTYVNKPEPTPPPGIDTEIPQMAIESGSLVEPGTPMDGPGAIPKLPDGPPRHLTQDGAAGDAPRFGGDSLEPRRATKSGTFADAPTSAPDLDSSAGAASKAAANSATVAQAKGSFADSWTDAQKLLSENRLVEAHAALSAWYGNPDLTAEEDQRLAGLLGQLAGTIIYSNSSHLLEPAYIVREGDSLKSIAAQYAVPPQLLAKINGVDEQASLRPGTKLKVVRGPFDAVLDLQRKEVSLQLRGQYAGRFKIVRTGVKPEQFKNASSKLTVKEKMNARGEHYVGLDGSLGIYAEDYSATALKMPAETSVVLSARDAEDVYDILTYESKVAVAP